MYLCIDTYGNGRVEVGGGGEGGGEGREAGRRRGEDRVSRRKRRERKRREGGRAGRREEGGREGEREGGGRKEGKEGGREVGGGRRKENIHSFSLQVLKEDDPLGEILKEIPEPSQDMLKSDHTCLTLDLIQGSRDTLGPWTELILGAVGVV